MTTQKFSGLEYVKIDIANNYGLDKIDWDDRIKWTDDNIDDLYQLVDEAKEPILMMKGINALVSALAGEATGFIMSLDATASGIQLMACLMGCKTTARAVNLIDTGHREDGYQRTSDEMNHRCSMATDRPLVKGPVNNIAGIA